MEWKSLGLLTKEMQLSVYFRNSEWPILTVLAFILNKFTGFSLFSFAPDQKIDLAYLILHLIVVESLNFIIVF